jgi:hypothetical protein
VHVDLKVDPMLRVKVEQRSVAREFTVPLIAAGAHPSAGSGHQ